VLNRELLAHDTTAHTRKSSYSGDNVVFGQHREELHRAEVAVDHYRVVVKRVTGVAQRFGVLGSPEERH
jgi:dTDP-glucose pyrophosphorylase